MTNQQVHWKESMKSFRRHVDPEMEERLKWIKIETENKLKRSLKLVKGINQNREGNLKKKSELTHLIEDISNEYHSMYTLYDKFTSEVRKFFGGENEAGSSSLSSSSSSSCTSNSDLEFYTPKAPDRNGEHQKAKQKPDASDSEDALLKDKLTSTSEIKKAPGPRNELPESELVFKDVEIQEERLLNLRQKLVEREEELLSIAKKHQAFEEQKLAEMKVSEDKVRNLKVELNTMSMSKKAFEKQVKGKTKEASLTREENSGLKVRMAELEQQFKQKENQVYTLMEELEEDKKGFQEHNNFLQKELELVSHQKSELESQVKDKSQEVTECLLQMEKLRDKLANKASHEENITDENVSPQVKVKDLEMEISTLSSKKKDLENQIISTKSESYHLRVENERLCARIFVLETTMKERENELSDLSEKLEVRGNEMSTRVRSLTEELQNLRQELQALQHEKTGLEMQLKQEKQDCSQNLTDTEKKNAELTNKIADQQKSLTDLENVVNKLTEEYKQVKSRLGETKSNYQIAEKKIEEMAEEFFKKCEDQLRILSRRIRVAEQLHVENKEWYLKTKDRYEQQNKELKERLEKNEIWLRNIKDISLAADNTLSALDGVALKFEGCTANFLNRISKVSCELKFAKDWIMRKNKAMSHVRDDLSCLLAQLDDKEAEILLYREKVWKSENKVRELEKLMNEKEEGMMALQEEKREAIRQLCVWIDYHRSHSDYYKKILSDMNVASKKTR